jgi:cobalt transporter subunit CbtB
MNTISQSFPQARAKVEPSTLLAAIIALSLGAALVFVVGFAQPDLLHNAAHDWRHSMNFPCH